MDVYVTLLNTSRVEIHVEIMMTNKHIYTYLQQTLLSQILMSTSLHNNKHDYECVTKGY